MKRLFAVLFIFIFISGMVFSNSSFTHVGNPSKDGNATDLGVAFSYDPDTMQRLTFGFTEMSDLHWENSYEDYGDKYFNLKTAYVRDKITYGYGNINFYWKLKTSRAINAILFLEGPLVNPNTGVELNWSLSFEPNNRGLGEVNINSYGIDNGKVIFSRDSIETQNVEIGYVPVRIKTAESDPSVGNQDYIGSIGVVVEAR